VAALGLESALLGLSGVLVGTALGVLFGVLSVFVLREPAVVPMDAVLLGAGALVLVAIVAGTLPALRTVRGSPLPATVD
jgi:ABC-type antimicrobial peptide transport system permease subunit